MVADGVFNDAELREDGGDSAGQGHSRLGRAGLEGMGRERAGPNRHGQNSIPGNPLTADAFGHESGGPFPNDQAPPNLPNPRKLAEDWITLWQSELSALAADPEIRETWQALASLWAGAMSAMLQGLPRRAGPGAGRHDRPGGQTGTADAPWTAPVAAAPDARDAEVERLARHVAVLERRLADLEQGDHEQGRLEHGGHPGVAPKRRSKRVPKRK